VRDGLVDQLRAGRADLPFFVALAERFGLGPGLQQHHVIALPVGLQLVKLHDGAALSAGRAVQQVAPDQGGLEASRPMREIRLGSKSSWLDKVETVCGFLTGPPIISAGM
jgi:hypothetical protein